MFNQVWDYSLRGLRLLILVAAATASGCRPVGRLPEVEYYPLTGAMAQQGYPFSSAVRVGSTIYLSGQIGTDSTGRLVPGGIEAETRQTLENISAVLARTGSSLDDVVKCTAMIADMQEWAAMNRVYVTYFRRNLPARSALGANGLALGARIELECIATVKRGL